MYQNEVYKIQENRTFYITYMHFKIITFVSFFLDKSSDKKSIWMVLTARKYPLSSRGTQSKGILFIDIQFALCIFSKCMTVISQFSTVKDEMGFQCDLRLCEFEF